MTAEQTPGTADGAGAGEWVEPRISYVEPARRHCALCGRPLARRVGRAATPEGPRDFCDPAHEALLTSYWLPTWGPARD